MTSPAAPAVNATASVITAPAVTKTSAIETAAAIKAVPAAAETMSAAKAVPAATKAMTAAVTAPTASVTSGQNCNRSQKNSCENHSREREFFEHWGDPSLLWMQGIKDPLSKLHSVKIQQPSHVISPPRTLAGGSG